MNRSGKQTSATTLMHNTSKNIFLTSYIHVFVNFINDKFHFPIFTEVLKKHLEILPQPVWNTGGAKKQNVRGWEFRDRVHIMINHVLVKFFTMTNHILCNHRILAWKHETSGMRLASHLRPWRSLHSSIVWSISKCL